TLDANSVALSEAIGSVAGDENAEAFLGLWREHIGFFVDYTLGQATGDQAAVDQALTDLEGYQQAAGSFFEEITAGELPADALVESLDVHIETLTAAIDALVAGDAQAFDLLQAAADHMPMAATAIAGAVVAAVPDMFDGEVDSAPAETRAVLTDLLQEHVYLAGIAIEQAVEAGGDMEAPAVQAAVATLDANSVELAEVVGSVSTPEDQEAFLGLWREHIGFFVDYTLGKATGDDAAAEQALTDLDGYQQAAGDFFERITAGELPADALVASLDEHVATLTTAIDSLVAGETSVFDDLRAAGQHMPMAAAALSAAIVAATS
ncbi:MAG TPA: copper amine oxidase, partial [Acidimicrobiaceae bacterium]|nr:copper amine oxidase [Acidimicrobiaceae bacterium]